MHLYSKPVTAGPASPGSRPALFELSDTDIFASLSCSGPVGPPARPGTKQALWVALSTKLSNAHGGPELRYVCQ